MGYPPPHQRVGPVFISLSQSRCDGISPETLVAVASVQGPFPAPTIVEPLFLGADAARKPRQS
jgi:hypothetical protein